MKSRRMHRIVRLVAPMTLGILLLMTVKVEAQTIIPVPLPDPGIPGFEFPRAEDVIVGWTEANDQAAINKHAWGIWTALTLETDQVFEGQKLLVFETWLTPADIISASPSPSRTMETFRQFQKAPTDGEETVTGFVKYDPTGATHIIDNDLLSKQTLDSLLSAGEKKVPDFPITAIALKPVFQTIHQGALVGGQYYKMAAWPGPPGMPLPGDAVPFPPRAWEQCIWIDVKNESKGNGSVDTDCKPDGTSRTSANTYNVSSLINFRLSAAEATLQNTGREPGKELAEGDYAVLAAMHVTSREITRWTWQTFWWTPNPDKPHFASSPIIAQERPAQLQGAARNYAHAPAYSMKNPPQPNTGGQNEGNSVYSYNPWLEAGFSKSVLPDSEPGTYDGNPVPNNVGMQTNCMSCHANANYNPKGIPTAPAYTGDRYIDLNSPQFEGTLQVDFLWSIPGSAQ